MGELFKVHLNQLLKYTYIKGSNSNLEVLNRVMEDLMILDKSIRYYFSVNKDLGQFAVQSMNFTRKIQAKNSDGRNDSDTKTHDSVVKKLDYVYKDNFLAFKRKQVIND